MLVVEKVVLWCRWGVWFFYDCSLVKPSTNTNRSSNLRAMCVGVFLFIYSLVVIGRSSRSSRSGCIILSSYTLLKVC